MESSGWLALADAICGPRLIDVNARASADAATRAGSFCHSHPFKDQNCIVDSVQLPPEMGNQWFEVDLDSHGATPRELGASRNGPRALKLDFAIESAEGEYGRTRDLHRAIPYPDGLHSRL